MFAQVQDFELIGEDIQEDILSRLWLPNCCDRPNREKTASFLLPLNSGWTDLTSSESHRSLDGRPSHTLLLESMQILTFVGSE
jgi:hypothetical protein